MSSPFSPNYFFSKISHPNPPHTYLKFGIDIARFQGDFNVVWVRWDNWLLAAQRWNGMDSVDNANRIVNTIAEWEELGWVVQWAAIDTIGVGYGVCDSLWHREKRLQHIIKPINVAKRSSKPDRFRNVRAEISWNLRVQFRSKAVRFFSKKLDPAEGIDHLIMENLRVQSTGIVYKNDERLSGCIIIESKDDYKSRTGQKSPDELDSLCLAFNDNLAGLDRVPDPEEGEFSYIMSR